MTQLMATAGAAPSVDPNPQDCRRRSRPDAGATGLETVQMGAGRIRVDDKRIINCRADSTSWCRSSTSGRGRSISMAVANHWMPQEINMNADIQLWKDPMASATMNEPSSSATSVFPPPTPWSRTTSCSQAARRNDPISSFPGFLSFVCSIPSTIIDPYSFIDVIQPDGSVHLWGSFHWSIVAGPLARNPIRLHHAARQSARTPCADVRGVPAVFAASRRLRP